jgi:glucose/arabinose dehydrogenase
MNAPQPARGLRRHTLVGAVALAIACSTGSKSGQNTPGSGGAPPATGGAGILGGTAGGGLAGGAATGGSSAGNGTSANAGTGGGAGAPGAGAGGAAGGVTAGSGAMTTGAGGASGASTGASGTGTAGGAPNGAGTSNASGGAAGATSGGIVPGTSLYDCRPPEGTLPTLKLTPWVMSLNNPIYVTHAPNETNRVFVLEQTGKVQVIKDGVVASTPFLDITTKVDTAGTWEQGLLGLAFHPDYAQNGLFYLHFNASAAMTGYQRGAAIIAEYKVSSTSPDVADPASERVVLSADTTNYYHNGGSIWFGPGKNLFIGLGDGAGDTRNPDLFPDRPRDEHLNRKFAQELTSLRGKMLRINPLKSGDQPYTSPSGNLKDEVPEALPEIWSYGLRNPYRSNIDACTADIYIGDVGDRAWEEHDVEPGNTGHFNYGWAIREGDACHKDYMPRDSCVNPERYRGPFDAHPNQDGGGPTNQASVGGSVYRGSAIPALRGTYFFTDLYGPIWTARYDAATDKMSAKVNVESQLNPAESDRGIVAIQNAGDGELLFVSRGGSGMNLSARGVIYKLEAVP